MPRMGAGRRVLAMAVIALTAAGAAPASADADRVWEGATTLTRPGTYASGPVATVTSRGETVVAWVEQDVSEPFPMRLATAVRRADGTIEPVRILADRLAGCVLDIASDAAGNVVVSWQLPDGTVKVARRPAGGEFSAPEVLDGLPGDSGGSWPRLAMNPRGDAAILWEDYVWAPAGPYVRYAGAFSPAGEPFSPTRDLSGPQPVSFAGYDVAVAADGDMVVVYAHDPRSEDPAAVGPAWVKALTRRPDGTVTEAQTLEVSATKRLLCPEAAADAVGRVAAMWRAIDERCTDYAAVSVARRPAGGPFSEPVTLPVPRAGAAGAALAMADDGRMAVSYLAENGPTVRTAPFDGPFGPPTVLSTGLWAIPTLAQGRGGRIVAGVWDYSAANEIFEISGDGAVADREDLPLDCATRIRYVVPVLGPGGDGALVVGRDDGTLALSVDRPSASPGPSACRPDQPPPPDPPAPEPPSRGPPPAEPAPSDPGSSPPGADASAWPVAGPIGPTPAPPASAPATSGPAGPDPGLIVAVAPARLVLATAHPYVDLRVRCSEPCTIDARGSLTSRGRTVLALARARTSSALRQTRLRLRFRGSRARGAASRRASAPIVLHVRDRLGRMVTRRVVARALAR